MKVREKLEEENNHNKKSSYACDDKKSDLTSCDQKIFNYRT